MAARRVSLKRDFAERSVGGRGFGPGAKRQDTRGAQGRYVTCFQKQTYLDPHGFHRKVH